MISFPHLVKSLIFRQHVMQYRTPQTDLRFRNSGSTDSPLEQCLHLLDSFGTTPFFNKSLLTIDRPRCQSDMDAPSSGSSSPNSSSSPCLLFSISWFSSVPLDFMSKPLLDTVRSLIFGSFFRSPVHSLQNKVFYQR